MQTVPFQPAATYKKEQDLFNSFLARERYTQQFGWHICTQESLTVLVELTQDKKVLDAGSGTGFLAQKLVEVGHCLGVVAADLGNSNYGATALYRRDYEGCALDLLPGDFDVVILAWPPYEKPFGAQVVSAMKSGQLLVYQGEAMGGCTGNDNMFAQLLDTDIWQRQAGWTDKLNEHHVRFGGIHDRWFVAKKS